jgi:hypothetical protein
MLFVNCYTAKYAKTAERLVESLEKLGLDYVSEEYEDRGSWEANCQYKAEFIYEMWMVYGQVVWLDADCVVRKEPTIFYDMRSDIAFHHYRGKEVLSGTLFFNDTDGAEKILKAWIAKNKERPNVWDQKNLQEVLKGTDVDITYLPPEYCCIFDLTPLHYGKIDPVIEHFQASRVLK